MRLTAYRLTKTRYVDSAFSGEGARLTGGRWNPIGMRMVYLASSLSLATLELLVHTEDYTILLGLFSVIPVDFDSSLVVQPDLADLPPDWDNPEMSAETQLFGASWLRSQRSLIFAVPSAVTPSETNYLINPEHPDVSKLKIGSPQDYHFDQRLVREESK